MSRSHSRISRAAFTLVEMSTVALIMTITASLVVGGAASSYRASEGRTTGLLVSHLTDGCVRQALSASSTGKVVGFSIRLGSDPQSQVTPGTMPKVALVPWTASVDATDGTLGTISRLTSLEQVLEWCPLPRAALGLDGGGVHVVLAPTDAITGFYTSQQTLQYMQSRIVASPTSLASDSWIHISFEPLTGRPHAIFGNDTAPQTGTLFTSMFGSGVGNGNSASGFGSVIGLSDLTRMASYPIELTTTDLLAQRARGRLVLLQSGVVERKGSRG